MLAWVDAQIGLMVLGYQDNHYLFWEVNDSPLWAIDSTSFYNMLWLESSLWLILWSDAFRLSGERNGFWISDRLFQKCHAGTESWSDTVVSLALWRQFASRISATTTGLCSVWNYTSKGQLLPHNSVMPFTLFIALRIIRLVWTVENSWLFKINKLI